MRSGYEDVCSESAVLCVCFEFLILLNVVDDVIDSPVREDVIRGRLKRLWMQHHHGCLDETDCISNNE